MNLQFQVTVLELIKAAAFARRQVELVMPTGTGCTELMIEAAKQVERATDILVIESKFAHEYYARNGYVGPIATPEYIIKHDMLPKATAYFVNVHARKYDRIKFPEGAAVIHTSRHTPRGLAPVVIYVPTRGIM